MDPLTAFGLAASIVQFVGFTSDLVSKSKEIYNSAKGHSDKVETLDTVYDRLRDLSSDLETGSQGDQLIDVVVDGASLMEMQSMFAIRDLAKSCKSDCDKLLDVVDGLRSDNGVTTRWKSFKLALKTAWKERKIADLEQSLHRTQTTLTLHICALTSFCQGAYQRRLEKLRAENSRLGSEHSSKLDDIAKAIAELGSRSAKPDHNSKPLTTDDISALEVQISDLTLSQRDAEEEHRILRSLGFESRPARYGSIHEAHQKTLSWVFEDIQPRDNAAAVASGNLIRWLKNPDGIFWVSGKPGSGKSTLMKYMTDHPTLRKVLSNWAYPERVVVACHYFWSAGTSMQKSYQGLLQTLLYDIFRQLPDLILATCTERWRKSSTDFRDEPWTLPELRRVLQRITEMPNVGAKFCFFIDGLDEFEGDHLDFCSALRDLSKSPHVKLCVSSRPWNIFEDSFGGDESRKLYVHDFTRPDILLYIESRLQAHPRWEEVNVEAQDSKWLIQDIAERAAGVFLWVFLVTRELRNGLTEYDSFSDMRKRLDNIPTDLEVFFKQILDSVEPFYHEKLATTLQIALAATGPIPLLVYSFHDDEYEDKDYAMNLPLKPLSTRDIGARKKQISRRLNGRCRGLLEFNERNGCIEFLHRTVMDYLRTPNMSSYLEAKAPAGFNPHLSLLKAFTAYIKRNKFHQFVDRTRFAYYTASKLMNALNEALVHAKELGRNAAAFELLEELERCIPEMHETGQARLNVWGNSANPVSLFFREPVVQAKLDEYLRYVLPKTPDYFADFEECDISRVGALALASTLERYRDGHKDSFLPPQGQPGTTADSDNGFAKASAEWNIILEHLGDSLPRNSAIGPDPSELEWYLQTGLISFMLSTGADPNVQVRHKMSPGHTVAWLKFITAGFGIAPGSFYQSQFLRDLDSFIANGADMRAPVSNPLGEGESTPVPGLDAFFSCLLRKTDGLGLLNIDLLATVAEKLMTRAKEMGMEIDCYWPTIEKAFRPQLVSRLKKSFSKPEASFGDANRVTQKRHLEDAETEEGSRKRARSV